MKPQREWFFQVPWGRMALKSHGHPDGIPVILVHGRQDSLSVFDPLIEQMPGMYYYVALDMPGNGLSDAFPRGPKLQRFHFLYAMELAIQHLGWNKFIFIGHSMGCEQGLFFNVIYPGRIVKMILLDAGPTLMRMQANDNEEYQKTFFDHYYDNYMRECFSRKITSLRLAKQATMRVRDLTEEQCAHILSRNFHESRSVQELTVEEAQQANEARNTNDGRNANAYDVRNANDAQNANVYEVHKAIDLDEALKLDDAGNAKNDQNADGIETSHINDDTVGYLSWDYRLKNLAPQNYGNAYYFELFKKIPPTLLIAASNGAKNVPPNPKWRQGAKELLDKMATLENFHRVDVEGSHDVHYTHPERVLSHINAFLKDNKVSAKL